MAPPTSSRPFKELPDHLLHKKILPRLPFKCLNRFKCLSKEIYSLITTDAVFAADQSRSAKTSLNGFVYMTSTNELSFFPNPAMIGVPDPSLSFLDPTSDTYKVKIVASTNGLLLLCGEFSGILCLCVCNPATKEMEFVPHAFVPHAFGQKYYPCREIGFAYDPCKEPFQFTIVDPVMVNHNGDGFLYQFQVYRSDTDKWTRSGQSIYIDTDLEGIKAVCAKGVLYWCCGKYLVWYDTERDLTGSLNLPVIEGKVIGGVIDVGVFADEITCCHAWSGGIEVWRLTQGSLWDRIYAMSWDGMVDAFDFCHSMRLRMRCTSRSSMFFERREIRPVGFDGRFVYIAVRLKYGDKSEKLFSWETATGQVEEKGLITTDGTWGAYQVFNYSNSMARLPQFLNGASFLKELNEASLLKENQWLSGFLSSYTVIPKKKSN